MTFSDPQLRYKATFQKKVGDRYFYQVEERRTQSLSRSFTAAISATQKTTAKGFDERAPENSIERWCELHQSRLPKDREIVDVDLDELQKL